MLARSIWIEGALAFKKGDSAVVATLNSNPHKPGYIFQVYSARRSEYYFLRAKDLVPLKPQGGSSADPDELQGFQRVLMKLAGLIELAIGFVGIILVAIILFMIIWSKSEQTRGGRILLALPLAILLGGLFVSMMLSGFSIIRRPLRSRLRFHILMGACDCLLLILVIATNSVLVLLLDPLYIGTSVLGLSLVCYLPVQHSGGHSEDQTHKSPTHTVQEQVGNNLDSSEDPISP